MVDISLPTEGSIEQRIVRIDGLISVLRSGKLSNSEIHKLDQALSDEYRLNQKVDILNWKVFELRMILDSFVVRDSRMSAFPSRRRIDSSPTIPLEVRRFRLCY